MENEKRRPGHPAYPPEKKRVTISCRVSPSTKAFLKKNRVKPGRLLDEVAMLWEPAPYTAVSAWLRCFTQYDPAARTPIYTVEKKEKEESDR